MTQIDYANILYKIYGSPKELKKEFIKEALDWEYFPVYKNDHIAALFMTKGSDIHCGCFPEYKGRWFPMKRFQRIIKDILLKYGKVTTSTFEESRKFVERLGFKEVSKNNEIIHFIKTEV